MQLDVERKEPWAGKQRLVQIHDETCKAEQKILRGVFYTPEALARRVRGYIQKGATVVCIDECSEKQIERLEKLKHEVLSDVRVHAVVTRN
ncbi:hypothetical protein NJF44_03570 [Pseudomonas guariconensis]|uniref:hypothetical protein n=1 Tax=Pseudomonas TaxID=286 RepID=UPI002097EFFF|nr:MULTISPECIES: hypothetical protein [Pseudomonas]MCO7637576.1 hypothetical protein [Pseudomonas sp. S 311-6]MCO7515227.1 hypothetical protein [Pseudomonas putida]MCO7565013.1 hypothetical protein [Pseudomonas mosselii]MCO7604313.1 hypothetical protein [Pseudomonas guariconensis]MCO7616537.1 hypothetical protein [Pseudomonas guariconensis]